ncbi:hypothetical protein DPMN_086867 [Dreissena polymorpha]|uniref:Uncharacterized protein n=1 Tax=Dreissena polymorpha TaxID=45954 RepID=A0A9D4KRY3_DREPO|nr:hypothetical protein DPMN_086867 [Dreissena polymorpha]
MHSHILAACASVPLGGPKGKSEDPRRVHAVNIESSQGTLSGSAVDRLVQMMERLEGTVGNFVPIRRELCRERPDAWVR